MASKALSGHYSEVNKFSFLYIFMFVLVSCLVMTKEMKWKAMKAKLNTAKTKEDKDRHTYTIKHPKGRLRESLRTSKNAVRP